MQVELSAAIFCEGRPKRKGGLDEIKSQGLLSDPTDRYERST